MSTDCNVTIEILISGLNSEASIAAIKSHMGSDSENVFFLSQSSTSESTFRFVDPVIVAALVSAVGSALASLITGLFVLAKERGSKRIVITTNTEDGKETRYEVPADDASLEKIEKLIEVIRNSERARITMISKPWRK
nr:hypothetical protein [uncultured Desulfobacter sp.]